MPIRVLLLDKITTLILCGYIDKVFDYLQLIDHLHLQADINKDFLHILVFAFGWMEVGAENIDEGEETQVGYTPLAHKRHNSFNTSFDIGAKIRIIGQHMHKELDINSRK